MASLGRAHLMRVAPRPRELPGAGSVLDLGGADPDDVTSSLSYFSKNHFLYLISMTGGSLCQVSNLFKIVSVINKTLTVGPSYQIFNIFQNFRNGVKLVKFITNSF
jgi:hypothetical protein